MLIQEYLRSGKTFNDLQKEFGITSNFHPELPLVILNYDMIESPKTDPIVKQCRGLVLNSQDYSLVAMCMPRFYNWGEVLEDAQNFDWNSVTTTEKADGSLVHLFNYNGTWFANTRNSFGTAPIVQNEYMQKALNVNANFTWQHAFCEAMGIKSLQDLNLNPSLTYVCEYCSIYNKVVRQYDKPVMYSITSFEGEKEYGPVNCKYFEQLPTFPLRNLNQIQAFILTHPENTWEGIVIKDKNNNRWKLKNARYVALHHMKGNNNLFLPKNIVPFVLAGETAEVLNTFPEATNVVLDVQTKIDAAYQQLLSLWKEHWQKENQKEFALSIVNKTPFASLLFQLRKELGKNQTEHDLNMLWRKSEDSIINRLF